VAVSLNSAVTDDGVLALAPTSAGYAQINGGSNNENSLTVGSGGVLSTVAGGAGSQPAYIDAPGTNQAGGTITIGAAESYQDDDNLITNAGTFQVSKSGEYTIPDGSGSELYGTSGTIGVTVNGANDTGGIGGLMVVSGSTLAVSTVGSPAVGSTFAPIAESQESQDGDVSFSALDCGRYACAVSYPSPPANELMLTLEAPFTTSSTPFSPHKDIPTGAVRVASIGSAANGTGAYSATVNWGDGTATQAATVNITGSTGTVTGPTHTYARSGTFRVKVSVANTDGNTLITTETVKVPVLAIGAVSPTSGPSTGGTTVTITGSGFTGATGVRFGAKAAKSFTVVSDTEITAVSPAHAAGTVGIRVTTPGGVSPAVAADRYTYT
jgi:hypothetical protein